MSNVATVQRRLYELGYSPVQVAGIIGNLQQESGRGLSPHVVGDSGTAYGIAQWRGPRFDGLQSFAQQRGVDWRDPTLQADYIHHELNTTERRAGDMLRNARSAEDATKAFIAFERPQGFTWDNPSGGHGFENRLRNAYSMLSTTPDQDGRPTVTPDTTNVPGFMKDPMDNQDALRKIASDDIRGLLDLYEPAEAMPKTPDEPMQTPTLTPNTSTPATATMLSELLKPRRLRGLL